MRHQVMAIALVAVLGGACANDNFGGSSVTDQCKTDVTSITSPAAGVATLKGNFYASESVIIRDGNTQIASGTPASDRTSFSLSGLPSGTHSWSIIISCNQGQDNLGLSTFVVM
jgi:hypothetical protein